MATILEIYILHFSSSTERPVYLVFRWTIQDHFDPLIFITFSNPLVHGSAYYGQGRGRIALDNLDCTGYESSIEYCNSNGWWQHNCNHNEDVGVNCLCKLSIDQNLTLVLGIGLNFIVDHRFCKAHWSSTNNRLVENMFILILALILVLIHNSKSRHCIHLIFFLFSMKTYVVGTH